MGRTKYAKKNLGSLSDMQMRFALEYLIDYNATRAAIAAGTKAKEPAVAGCKLLSHPKVAAYIGKVRRQTAEKLELSREKVLLQLYYLATRSGADFVNAEGRLIANINNLPERAQQAIDGIEQEVTTFTTDSGQEITKVKTKLKLVGKAKAIDMAMRHRGLFAPDKLDVVVKQFNWNQFSMGSDSIGPEDIVDATVIEKPKPKPKRLKKE